MSELTQIFIDLSGLKVGWGGTCLKGWGLKAMMSEFRYYVINQPLPGSPPGR